MHKLFKITAIGLVFLISQFCHADTAIASFVGVWQDQSSPPHYLSVQYNAATNTTILIDLAGIEYTQSTLFSSYSGTLTAGTGGISGLLISIGNNNAGLQVQFNSDYTGTLRTYPEPPLVPSCNPCGNVRQINKIF